MGFLESPAVRFFIASFALILTCAAAPADDAPAKDAYGDPLPAGALARLGPTRLRHPGGAVSSLAYLPDGKGIVSAGAGPNVVLWDVSDGKEKRRWTFDGPVVKRLAVSPDGKFLA